jgi:hypothetical protein
MCYARVPMHVVYLVPEIQIKHKNEYGNTQQVQHGTKRTIIIDKHQNFTRKHGFYRKTEVWVSQCWLGVCQHVGSEFTNLRQYWLGIYQPATQ